jgi:2-polyprenyl-3-methyl-5-hydroxy-6-metoxy-1,4-benzoquinol methylase
MRSDALDAGCGTGFLSFQLAGRGHPVTGVDSRRRVLAEARRKTAETPFRSASRKPMPSICRFRRQL